MKQTIMLILLLALGMTGAAAKKDARQPQRLSVSILGDSYSTFQGYLTPDTNAVWYPHVPGNDVKRVEDTWWHRLITEKGWKLCRNNSYSGSTICYHGYNNEDYRLRSFENRADDLGNPDVIFIFGGTNDSWSKAQVGDYKYAGWQGIPKSDRRVLPPATDDKRGSELYTYRPALAKMLDYMTRRYINVRIVFILNSELREDITSSTLEICAHYNVPVIQLHDIDKQKGHPSVKGMASIAEQVGAFVEKIW